MQAATRLGVPGIIGECGGALSSATCDVVVDPAGADRAGPPGAPGAFEQDMLDIAEAGREPTSRLSCRIRMSARRWTESCCLSSRADRRPKGGLRPDAGSMRTRAGPRTAPVDCAGSFKLETS